MNENVYMHEKIFTTSAVRKANGKHLTVLRTTPIKYENLFLSLLKNGTVRRKNS